MMVITDDSLFDSESKHTGSVSDRHALLAIEWSTHDPSGQFADIGCDRMSRNGVPSFLTAYFAATAIIFSNDYR